MAPSDRGLSSQPRQAVTLLLTLYPALTRLDKPHPCQPLQACRIESTCRRGPARPLRCLVMGAQLPDFLLEHPTVMLRMLRTEAMRLAAASDRRQAGRWWDRRRRRLGGWTGPVLRAPTRSSSWAAARAARS